MEDIKEKDKELPKNSYEDYKKEGRVVYLTDYITPEFTHKIIDRLLYLNSISNRPIYMIINSGGGSIRDALGIIDVMNMIESPIFTIATGKCDSAATTILASGAPGCRAALKHTTSIIHDMSGGYYGKYNELLDDRDNKILYRSMFINIYKDRTKITNTIFNKRFMHSEKALKSEELLKLKVIDKVLDKFDITILDREIIDYTKTVTKKKTPSKKNKSK